MILETIKKLCSLRGVSGDEGEVREYIIHEISDYADTVSTDVMGNIIAFKQGKKRSSKKILLAAHMDEVGIMVNSITEDGYVKFSAVGGIDPRLFLGTTVYIGDKKVLGVIGCKAIHLVSSDEQKSVPDISDMYIDIGANTKGDAEKQIAVGDTGCFEDNICEFGNGYIRAKALDDRVGCAALIELIKSEIASDTYFAFTVQEEVGCRGALGAAFSIRPDIALIIEGTTAADIPTVDETKQICKLGHGVVIPFMDRGTIYSRELYRMLTETAENNGIAWQTKTYIAGGTDASAIQRSAGGVLTAGLAVAIRNIHAPASIAKVSDIECMLSLAENFLYKLGECEKDV